MQVKDRGNAQQILRRIIGYGEIGSSVEKLYLGREYNIAIHDPEKNYYDDIKDTHVLNICIPYNGTFIDEVITYVGQSTPDLVIIHSTVLPGTTDRIRSTINTKVVHSPVRGNHPDLYHSLKTFVKYIGAGDEESYEAAYAHFKELNVVSSRLGSLKSTEIAKLMCTTYYGLCIAWHNEMDKICKDNGISFNDAVTKWNKSYNEGYKKLGMESVVRPVLYPPNGHIGGHCVIPNAKLLKEVFNSSIVDFILTLE